MADGRPTVSNCHQSINTRQSPTTRHPSATHNPRRRSTALGNPPTVPHTSGEAVLRNEKKAMGPAGRLAPIKVAEVYCCHTGPLQRSGSQIV
mmetsp:Transcript_76013/g.126617  ORF Transcript_76013/g.126617 Transcript_76013/m.126617 type:complete len:92 (-) Transcript_76013:2704-2979(-)